MSGSAAPSRSPWTAQAWRDALHYGEGCLDSGPVPCAMTEWKLEATKLEPASRKYLDGYDPAEARRLLAEAGFPRGFQLRRSFYWAGGSPRRGEAITISSPRAWKDRDRAPSSGRRSPGNYLPNTTALGKFEKMAMGPFGAGDTEVDKLPVRDVLLKFSTESRPVADASA